MLFINHLRPNEWWEWNQEKMEAINYMGGHHKIDENSLGGVECYKYDSWHELYLAKRFCPLETDKRRQDVWISPDGKYYQGDAHDLQAEYISDIIYGIHFDICDFSSAGDFLTNKGWIKATTSMMWEVRFDEWKDKIITQRQYDALWDWCECHNKRFPIGVETI